MKLYPEPEPRGLIFVWLRLAGLVPLRHAGLHLRRARLQLPHRFAEVVQFALVFDFLTLGEFQSFQQFIQLLDHTFQCLDDAINVLHRLRHGGA